jgi:adenylate kinase
MGLEARRYMERGQLVPDEITIKMLLGRLAARDAADGVILDGFPRNRAQAETLDVALAEHGARVDHAVSIEVPSEDLVRRLSGRWVCRDSGHVYNETTNPPRTPGRCDLDASPLIQREDDRAETIRARLALQLSSLRDVVAYYRATGILRTVDGRGAIDDVADAVLAAVTDDGASGG